MDDAELARVFYADDTFDNMVEIVRVDGMEYALAYSEFHNLESQAFPKTKEQKKTSETSIPEESKDTCVGISFLSYLFLYLLF